MSMYNMIFAPNAKVIGYLGAMLGFVHPAQLGRLRDAWLERTTEGELRIAVYTRNGGGNRRHSNDELDEGPDCDCTGCIISYVLPKHELYLFDKDDDFDGTYATVYFKLPDSVDEETLAMFKDIAVEPRNMSEEWHAAIDAIGT